MENDVYIDDKLGYLTVKRNLRAGRYSIKARRGKLYATIPYKGTVDVLLSIVKENRGKLEAMLLKSPGRMFLDENSTFECYSFRLSIVRGDYNKIYVALKEEVLLLTCPENVVFRNDRVQALLWGIIEKAMRYEAKRILPGRLKMLSDKFGFTYSAVKINNSRSRWGSCTSRKTINLTLSLLLLPERLIDYVLLHELCHTREMNHSERFWRLMNSVTENKALEYRKELKRYDML
jgi:predicted metal-dependent hydrolase